MNPVNKVIRLLRLNIGVAVDEHTAVVWALKLLFGVRELVVQVLYHVELVRGNLNIAVLDHLVEEQKQVYEPHLVAVQIGTDLLIIVMGCTVVGEKRGGGQLVKSGYIAELVYRELIGELVAVYDLGAGNALNGGDMVEP